MTPTEVTKIVRLLAADFTQAQWFELVGRLSGASLMEGGSTELPPVTPIQTVLERKTPEKALPNENGSRGNVMIPEGHMCECDQCNAVVYEVVENVYEHMGKKDFVACFMPLGTATDLKMPLDTFADASGNLAIDCPLCKGTKSLWIKGRGDVPFNAIPTGDV